MESHSKFLLGLLAQKEPLPSSQGWLTLPSQVITISKICLVPLLLSVPADYNGSYLNQNAVSDHELHTHINDEGNWAELWELSESLTKERFSL